MCQAPKSWRGPNSKISGRGGWVGWVTPWSSSESVFFPFPPCIGAALPPCIETFFAKARAAPSVRSRVTRCKPLLLEAVLPTTIARIRRLCSFFLFSRFCGDVTVWGGEAGGRKQTVSMGMAGHGRSLARHNTASTGHRPKSLECWASRAPTKVAPVVWWPGTRAKLPSGLQLNHFFSSFCPFQSSGTPPSGPFY